MSVPCRWPLLSNQACRPTLKRFRVGRKCEERPGLDLIASEPPAHTSTLAPGEYRHFPHNQCPRIPAFTPLSTDHIDVCSTVADAHPTAATTNGHHAGTNESLKGTYSMRKLESFFVNLLTSVYNVHKCCFLSIRTIVVITPTYSP